MKVHLQPMNVKGKYCLSFDDFECQYIILELSLRANEGHIGVNKSILSIKQLWTLNKLTSVFYASVLLLIMNFVVTLSK